MGRSTCARGVVASLRVRTMGEEDQIFATFVLTYLLNNPLAEPVEQSISKILKDVNICRQEENTISEEKFQYRAHIDNRIFC